MVAMTEDPSSPASANLCHHHWRVCCCAVPAPGVGRDFHGFSQWVPWETLIYHVFFIGLFSSSVCCAVPAPGVGLSHWGPWKGAESSKQELYNICSVNFFIR